MQIKIIYIGRIRERIYDNKFRKYLEWISQDAKLEVITLKESHSDRIINQVNNSEPSMIGSSSRPIDSISIVISGDLVYLPLEDRIQSYKESDNYGNIEKLTNFFELLKLIR